MGGEYTLEGRALVGELFEEQKVALHIRDGVIIEIEERHTVPERWVCPAFFNAHTHIADTVAMDIDAPGSLAELVAPPDGLKHRLLRTTGTDAMIHAMRGTVDVMRMTGTSGFADFREGGPAGVAALRTALGGSGMDAVIFGRDGGEADADGLGISSVREHGAGTGDLVARARSAGKMVALHAGEKHSRDVEEAIALEPDLLVHCTHATDRQLRMIADAGIPVAVCPRSNWRLGVASSPEFPPIRRMLDIGCNVVLGTDNVMFVQPDMGAEMSFVSYVYGLEPATILGMATAGAALAGASYLIAEQNKAHFITVDGARGNALFSKNIARSVVNRLNSLSFEGTILN
ncbi:amidohydrolase [Methanomicrobiaceae archaeon CYW5]|uniref:amidohydrolase family protein n=1 Tax=Methanovulcanius yangii TaxID=1789227 RepID=UPI0029C9F164|nr:amidohydrolase family protein [Methanovulcanius yangii]MBT8507370.1 amidohydrolase [Methanovulcanius yangii]